MLGQVLRRTQRRLSCASDGCFCRRSFLNTTSTGISPSDHGHSQKGSTWKYSHLLFHVETVTISWMVQHVVMVTVRAASAAE